MYTHLAPFYDWPGVLDFSEKMLEKILVTFDETHIQKPGPVLDLACGTGTLTTALAQAGWDVTGLDRSPEMLSEARKKAGADNVTWLTADMRHFTLPQSVQAVLCTYDSVNHLLTQADVFSTFQSVQQNLREDGLFIFDTNTEETFRQLWRGKDISEEENYRLLFDTRYDAATGKAHADITAEIYTEEGLQRLYDRVAEQFHDNKTLENLLQQAGFTGIRHEPFTPLKILPDGNALKTLWVCQK